jgi:hypothetical protein
MSELMSRPDLNGEATEAKLPSAPTEAEEAESGAAGAEDIDEKLASMFELFQDLDMEMSERGLASFKRECRLQDEQTSEDLCTPEDQTPLKKLTFEMFESSCKVLADSKTCSFEELVQTAWRNKPSSVTVSISRVDGTLLVFSVLPHQSVSNLKRRVAQLSGDHILTMGLYLLSDCGEPLLETRSVDDIMRNEIWKEEDQTNRSLDLTLVIDSRMPVLLIGAVFIQRSQSVGVASYHFVSADEVYINYAAAPRVGWTLDDGTR